MVTTPGKNFLGQRGFPTPDTTPETSACRTFRVPDNDDWLGLLMGAVEILTEEWAYYQWGSLTPVEAAAKWLEIFIEAQEGTGAIDCSMVPAPYWDDTSGDDAPAEAPADSQDWYGTWDGETFLESVSYVFLTGFLARLIGAQAAIKFLTIPRAFRVLIRQNPHGANLLLFLDGGLYKVINGYSPFDQIAEFLIASPGTELMLVVDSTHDPDSTPNADGDYVVDVIRTRLALEDVTPPNVRYYGTPPAFQTTYDGGSTWVDTPNQDVRHSPFAQYPHLGTSPDLRCDAAERMSKQLKDCITLMCNVADAAQAVTGLLELILLPEGLVGLLLDLFFTIANWIIDNGQAAILAAFTDTVYDDIKCALFCRLQPDGSITQTNLDAAWEAVKTLHSGTVATTIDEVRFLFTDNVFTNAGIKRTETGVCDDCTGTFDHTFDFATGQHGWTIVQGAYGGDPPHHFGGGIDGGGVYLEIKIGFPETSITDVYITYTVNDVRGNQPSADLYMNDALVAFANSGYASGTNHSETIHFTFDNVPCNGIHVNVGANTVTTCNIYAIEVKGLCADPF